MITRLIGRAHLSPEGGGGGASEREAEGVTQAQAAKMTEEELANVTVTLKDGTEVSGKEFTESRRKQPDVEKRLAEEREKLESEHKSRMDELDKREAELQTRMDEASTKDVTRVADAIRDALGGGRNQDPFASKESAKAYITNALRNEGGDVALNALVDRMFEGREFTAAKVKELEDKFAALKEENERERTQERVRREADRIVRDIQALHEKDPDFPLFNPKGRDEFSLMVGQLLRDEEKSDILDGKVGADTDPVEVARLVNAYLEKRADERVTKREAAKKRSEASDAAQPRESGGEYKVPDEYQKELDAARKLMETDPVEGKEKLNAVFRKIAAGGK